MQICIKIGKYSSGAPAPFLVIPIIPLLGDQLRTYLINLDRSLDRLNWFMRQAETLGLDVVRVPAIDGDTIPTSLIAKHDEISPRYGNLSPRVLGCFLSHVKVWQMIVDAGDQWAFVAEDDCHISNGIGKFLSSCDWIPDGIDIVKAETVFVRVKMLSRPVCEVNGRALRVLKSFHAGSGGYFLSISAAGKLLELAKQHCEPVDHFLYWPSIERSRWLNAVQLDPAICIQDSVLSPGVGFASLLDDERQTLRGTGPGHYKARGIAKVLRELRRIALQVWNFVQFSVSGLFGRTISRIVLFE